MPNPSSPEHAQGEGAQHFPMDTQRKPMAAKQTITQENLGKASTALKNPLLAASRHTWGTPQHLSVLTHETNPSSRKPLPPNTLSSQPDLRTKNGLTASTVSFLGLISTFKGSPRLGNTVHGQRAPEPHFRQEQK